MRRYLIVDDNAQLAENVAEIFTDRGDSAIGVSDPQKALELVRTERFDALITDLQMPVMNGVELVRQARQIDAGLPALALTAYAKDTLAMAAQQQGLLGVLPKPVPIEHLLELVKAARRSSLVLLVEDDAALSDNLAEAMRLRGLGVAVARTVIAVEQMVREIKPTLALVDLRVTGGDAGAAVAALTEQLPGVPLIVMSAFHDLAALAKSRPFFEKPFDTAALLAAIDRLIAAAQMEP